MNTIAVPNSSNYKTTSRFQPSFPYATAEFTVTLNATKFCNFHDAKTIAIKHGHGAHVVVRTMCFLKTFENHSAENTVVFVKKGQADFHSLLCFFILCPGLLH